MHIRFQWTGLWKYPARAAERSRLEEKSAPAMGVLNVGWDISEEDLTWHSKLLEWHGVVDYGPDVTTIAKDGIATHCLVLIFRPYTGNWIQPIACFATLNAASGPVLYEIVMKAIVMLHNHDAIVKSTVCDGCTSNKNAMTQFGITGEGGSDKCFYSFDHPMEPTIKIRWMFDLPFFWSARAIKSWTTN